MAATASPSTNIPSRTTFACIRCAERKVKCDRQKPSCSACTKHKAECIFNTSKPPRKRHKRVKVQFLADRLNQYEALLQEHGIDTSKLSGSIGSGLPSRSSHITVADQKDVQLQTPSSLESEPSREPDRNINPVPQLPGQVQFKFVENSLWMRVVEEAHDPENTFDNSDASSDEGASDDGRGFLLRHRPKSNSRPRHPLPEIMHQLWEIFVENVDPLTKVVHVPTLRPAFQKAAAGIKTVPRNFEALMFSIYGTAIMSLNDAECQQRFSEPHKSLLSRYTRATEAALSRAKFMETTSLTVLQAVVLHLLAVRDIYEPRALWTLTGVAIRIAQIMGLERDGSCLGLPPFETEIRRRIWWQLKMHDFRTAELCGLAKFRDLDMGAESTKWPTNVDDDQLSPDMTSLVAESNRVTDMAFVVFRCEMTEFAAGRVAKFRKEGLKPSQWNLHTTRHDKSEIETAVKGLQDTLEMKYLRYCDPSQPLHQLTMLVGRYGMNVVTFLTHHPRSWASMGHTPLLERQLVWDVSVKLLEQQNMVQTNPMLRPFAWHATYFRQWHAFIHVLNTLRAEPLKDDATKAWGLIISTYENTPAMLLDMRKPIHVAVGNLSLKAYAAREAALLKGNTHLPPTPDFILQLLQWREVAKAKREVHGARSNRPAETLNPGQGDTYDIDQVSAIHLNDPDTSMLTGVSTSQPPGFFQASETTESDPFYLLDGFDYNRVGSSEMDFDYSLPEDYNMEDSNLEHINWAQWDAWLADSNVMRSSS